jgi:hypothetical protein
MYASSNNNNIYLLQMGCHPVAVITLHVFSYTATKFTYVTGIAIGEPVE